MNNPNSKIGTAPTKITTTDNPQKTPDKAGLRDNNWLEEQLLDLWENNFADVPRKNLVLIKFGKGSRRQLGSIRWATTHSKIAGLLKNKKVDWEIQDDKRISIITITNHFRLPAVPKEVVLATIAHEMAHYAHGFHSPLPQIVDHPHRGNIIKKELYKRGLKDIHDFAEKWLKESWAELIKSISTPRRQVRKTRVKRISTLERLLFGNYLR